MRLRYKTNLAFLAALIALAIIGFLSVRRDLVTKEDAQWATHSRDVLEASEMLRSHVYGAASARRAYLLLTDPTRIDAFSQASKSAVDDCARLRKLTADNPQQQLRLSQLEPLIRSRLALLETSVKLRQSAQDDGKQQEAIDDQNSELSVQITARLDEFDQSERELLQKRNDAAQASYGRQSWINTFLGVCVFLFLIITLGLLNRELTRREIAEQGAIEQKELLQSILDSCNDAVIVADATGKIILRNPVGVRYNAGAPVEELSAEYPRLLGLYKKDRETLFRTEELPLSRALAGESANGLELYVRSPKGGEPQWMLAAGGPLLTSNGEMRGGVVFLRNITDRKEAEDRFQKVFHVSPEPTLLVAFPEGTFIDVNESFLRITGYSREETIGHTSMELKLFKNEEERSRLTDQMQEHGSFRDFELNFYTRTGEERAGLHSAEFIEIDGRRCIVAVLKDITEQKLLEQRLRQAQKMEAIGQFSGGIAHDFNNLLGIIIGYSEVLEQRLIPGDIGLKECAQIKKAGQSAASLTRQLLAFSRQQVLAPKVLNLNTVAADTEKMLRRLIGKDIELITKLASDLGQIKADPGQMEQVILNLAVNARDAMPEGGKLIIETRNVYLDEEYASHHPPTAPGHYITLVMTDTGVGIDERTQSHIFEPFFTTKEMGKGTGLGLATVYGVVKQSGGYIWVYSEPGLGSTFKIYLPRVDEAVQPELTNSPERGTVRGSKTVLIVEDEESLRELTHTLLLENGFTVLEADNGKRALEIASQYSGPIHLLLTDMMMPGMNGRAVAEKLTLLRPEMAVIYMSGYSGFNPRGMLDSETNFLSKPITRKELIRKVSEVLSAQKEQEVT